MPLGLLGIEIAALGTGGPIAAGAVEYLIKPISAVDLIQLVSKFCRPLVSEL